MFIILLCLLSSCISYIYCSSIYLSLKTILHYIRIYVEFLHYNNTNMYIYTIYFI